MEPKVIISNDYGSLAGHLHGHLYDRGCFRRKIVASPSDSLKEFLQDKWIKEEKGIVSGIRFLNLNLTIDHMLTLASDFESAHRFPRKEYLSFFLEELLKRRDIDPNVNEYLEGAEKRRIDLSDLLSDIFMHYFIYDEIDRLPPKHWQRKLLDAALSQFDHPARVIERIKKTFDPSIEMDIHFFGFSFIPQAFLDFILAATKKWNIFFYQFSPTPLFWGDVLNREKGLYYEYKMQKKGANFPERKALNELLLIENEVIAHCLEAGKILYQVFVDRDIAMIEDYTFKSDTSLLHRIQNDIANMEQSNIQSGDDSIEIHACPSRLREIQLLKTKISQLVYEKKYVSEDFLVFAPNLETYEPYIEYVFSQETSPFGYEMNGIKKAKTSELIFSFTSLLKLFSSRFTPADVFSVLQCKPALQKMEVSEEEFKEIQKKVDESKIRWGMNRLHKEKLSEKKQSERGSWEYIVKQWILSLAYERGSIEAQTPYELGAYFDFSNAEALGKFVHQLEYLYELSLDIEEKKQSLRDWAEFLMKVLSSLYEVREQEEYDYFYIMEGIQKLSKIDPIVKDGFFSFQSVSKRLLQWIEQTKGKKSSKNDKPKIRFFSLHEGGIVDKKVIICMGVDEESFPRVEERSSLSYSPQLKEPTMLEKDRFLFMQLLLNAQEKCYFFYSEQSEDPNVLLSFTPLLGLLEKYPIKSYRHSPYPFEKRYFDPRDYLSDSIADYQAANAYYFGIEQSPPISCNESKEKKGEEEITVKQLISFASHPIKHYFNHKLGIYLPKEEGSEVDQEEFQLSYVTKSSLEKQAIYHSLENLIHHRKLSGNFPTGVFEKVADEELLVDSKPKIDLMREFFNEPTYLLRLSDQEEENKEPQIKYHNPVEMKLLDGTRIKITGELPYVGEKTLYLYGRKTFDDLIKCWPLILLYRICEPQGEEIGLIKDQKRLSIVEIDAVHHLRQYIEYYRSYQESPSYLLPKWARAFLLKEEEEINKEVKSAFHEQSLFPDPYLLTFYKEPKQILLKDGFNQQKKEMKKLFEGFIRWHEKV